MARKHNSTSLHCLVAYLLIELTISTVVEARLKHVPADIIARPGENVRFNCSTESLDSVDWTYRKEEGKSYTNIFIGRTGGGGDKSNGYKIHKRIHVDFDIPVGRYDLIIRNVKQTDEGVYTCFDISDPESPASAKLLIIATGEAKTELCSDDVAAAVGTQVQLSFATTQTHSIHLEHRSVYKSYPLHVFRDGRIVNDYYFLSGRFSIKVSAGVWTLVIKDVQMADAGTYICSEDNGLGKQNVVELIVIESKNTSHGEMCKEKNCTIRFAGNCPPRLEWRRSTDGENGEVKRLRSVTTRADSAVTLIRTEDGDQELSSLLSCVVMNTFSEDTVNQRSFLTIQELSSCKEHEAVGHQYIAVILTFTVIGFVALTLLLVIWFMKRRSLICQLPRKPDDVATPARLPIRGTSTPPAVMANRETPVNPLLVNGKTPTATSPNGCGVPGSSTRRRTKYMANLQNMYENSANNQDNHSGENAKAKRKLALDSSFSHCHKSAND